MTVKEKINTEIYNYIISNYKQNEPILIKDIYTSFTVVNETTIRSILKRLAEKDLIIKIKNGVCGLPNKESIMGKSSVYTSDILRKKYLVNENGFIGYKSGLSFANFLGLTTQTSSVESVITNAVSNKKRVIKINNNRFIINAPRYEVTNENYKLLQILDLLNEFDSYSEIDLKTASKIILKYITNINLTEEEIEKIVSSYPLEAQVRFYKIGGQNVIASE